MSFNTYTSTFTVNEDGTSVYTINMSDVTTKCMQAVSVDPKGWIDNAIEIEPGFRVKKFTKRNSSAT